MRAFVIKLALYCPQLFAQRNPVVGHVITHVVLFLRHPEHGDLPFIPARNNVEAKAATGNMVNGCDLFGRAYRVHGRHMKGCEHTDFLGFSGQSSGPGERLKIAVVEVHFAAHAFPSRDGNDGLDPSGFRQLSRLD